MSEALRRYKLLDVGLTGIFFQAIAIWVAPRLPQWISANSVTALGGLSCVGIIFALISPDSVAGVLILAALFLDFLDGAIAKYRNTASQFGRVFDGTVDVFFWLAVLIGLYISGSQASTLGLLVIYTIDISWRLLLGHSTSLINHGGEQYKKTSLESDAFRRLKPFVYPFVNYYDSICALSLILVVSPQHIDVWLSYEIFRRSLLLIKKIREISYLYAKETS